MIRKVFVSLLATLAPLAASSKAVVFDFGGVMTHQTNNEATVQFLRETFSLSQEQYLEVNQEKRKSGKDNQEFWQEYAQKKGFSLPENWESSFNQVMLDALCINQDMYDFVEQLKKTGIRVALFSNVRTREAKFLREMNLYAPFDTCVLSCEIGINKPNEKAYTHLLDTLDLPADKVIFIDDSLENVEAARKLGIHGVHFTTQLRSNLEKLAIVLNELGGASSEEPLLQSDVHVHESP